MWLIPSSLDSPSVLELVASNSASGSPSPDTCVWVTSSGKALQRPLSWIGWRTRSWSPRLFSRAIWQTSTPEALREWISSRPASLASRGPSPEPSAEPPTSAGSGRTSSECSGKFNPDGSFSKTSLDLFQAEDSDPSSVIFTASGSMRNGVCSERVPWVPPTAGVGSSFWPTARVSRGSYTRDHAGPEKERPSLAGQAIAWGTPCTNGGAPTEQTVRWTRLADQVCFWPTAWPSPRAEDAGSAGNQAVLWPTPSQAMLARYTRDEEKRRAPNSGGHRRGHEGNELLRACHSFPPDPASSSCGPECSPKHRRLNPLFVEWLMGWPTEWTGSGPSATEFTRYKLRWRSYCWLIVRTFLRGDHAERQTEEERLARRSVGAGQGSHLVPIDENQANSFAKSSAEDRPETGFIVYEPVAEWVAREPVMPAPRAELSALRSLKPR